MRKLLLLFAFWLAAPVIFAQTTTPPTTPPSLSDLGFSSFSMTASVVGLKGSSQTIPATDLVQALSVKPSFSLRADEFLGGQTTSSSTASSPANLQAYFGGFKRYFNNLKPLQNTSLSSLQLYVTGGAGVNRYNNAAGNPVNALAFYAGGGANLNPPSMGNASINLFELRWMRLPGFQNNTLAASVGVKLSF